jgi:CBS domain-containing protein
MAGINHLEGSDMQISEVRGRNIATVGKEASVLRAAAIMRQHHVRDLVVVERKLGGWMPAGIISEHDIAIEVVGQGLDPRHVTVDAAMRGRLSPRHTSEGVSTADGAMTMDTMLTLLVTELNRIGQPLGQQPLAQPARPKQLL